MAILPIAGLGAASALTAPTAAAGTAATAPAGAAAGANGAAPTSFSNVAAQAIDSLQQTQNAADTQALQASTGGGNPADLMISSTEASLQTQLTVAVRNQAVDAFNQIMAMQF